MANTMTAKQRRCAICGKARGGVWAMSDALRAIGRDPKLNAYAHPSCVNRQRKRQVKP